METNHYQITIDTKLDKRSLSKLQKNLAAELQKSFSNVGITVDDKLAKQWAADFYKEITVGTRKIYEEQTDGMEKMLNHSLSAGFQKITDSNVIMAVISKIMTAAAELKEINTVLAEIGKINTNLSVSSLKEIGGNSFETASKYGKKAVEYLTNFKEVLNAGYENTENIAELSTALQAADNITSELANRYIFTTDKAYELDGSVKKLTETLDGASYLSGQHAIRMSELAKAMSIVGTQAASSQMELDETTAAIAALLAVTQQDGSVIGNSFNSILMNVRQVTGKIKDGGNAIDKEALDRYREACEALGVSLTTISNGTVSLKEPMQILKELSEEYTRLDESDAKRRNLLDATGGQDRATTLNALLENYSLYEEMLWEYGEGTDTLAAKAEKTANSWEGSLNRLSNTWTDTVGNIVDSDMIISVINGFNELLNLINKTTDTLGTSSALTIAGGGILAFFNKDESKQRFCPSWV
ncbi:MAG: phage tail tape measure protein [Bacteroides sp.]|nr:phage tail tape measure protein [Bacteroides sp.]MCM1549601.1 phage tail tape measure protein [Clostridium sp.]